MLHFPPPTEESVEAVVASSCVKREWMSASDARRSRRQSSGESAGEANGPSSDPRRYSCGSYNDLRDIPRQNVRFPPTLEDIGRSNSYNNNNNERRLSAAEKKSAWVKAHNNAGVLSSFDSSRFSSTNNISSIDALLDERRGDAEQMLTSLGFAPASSSLKLEHRLPARFLHTKSPDRSLIIERFIAANSDQFPELIARRELQRRSLDEGCSRPGIECDATASDPGPLCRVISTESVMRLRSMDLPPRFLSSINERPSQP